MAKEWEPFLTEEPIKEGAMVAVTVEYRKEGEETIVDRYRADRFTKEWLENIVRNKVAALNTTPEALTAGKINTAVPEPSAADVEARAWHKDFQRFSQANLLLQAGVIGSANATLTALKTRLKDNFKVEYIDFV